MNGALRVTMVMEESYSEEFPAPHADTECLFKNCRAADFQTDTEMLMPSETNVAPLKAGSVPMFDKSGQSKKACKSL